MMQLKGASDAALKVNNAGMNPLNILLSNSAELNADAIRYYLKMFPNAAQSTIEREGGSISPLSLEIVCNPLIKLKFLA